MNEKTRNQALQQDLIKGINTWTVPFVRYLGPFLKWVREELQQMDKRTRMLRTMHKALHLRDGINRQFVSRKEERRELISLDDSVDASRQRPEQRKTNYSD